MKLSPSDVRIIVSRYPERSADVVARIKAEPGSVPEYVVVGQALRVDGDEETKEEWKAWLWPAGDEYPPRGQHCEAMTRPSPGDLEVLLNKKLASEGRWWA